MGQMGLGLSIHLQPWLLARFGDHSTDTIRKTIWGRARYQKAPRNMEKAPKAWAQAVCFQPSLVQTT